MRKKGFTFAELMVSLVIIAVITVILYPTISDLAPNNNRYLFKSAYKSIETIVSEITAAGAIPNSALLMCQEFENRLNVINTSAGSVCTANQMFQTTNGIRWAFEYNALNLGADVGCTAPNTCNHRIWFDVNASNNNINSMVNNAASPTDATPALPTASPNLAGAWAGVDAGKGVFYDKTGVAGANITQDTFFVLIRNDGKIIVPDNIAREHLLNAD